MMGKLGPIERTSNAIRTGEVTATRVVTHALEQIEKLDSKLNSVVMTCAESALEQAANIDRDGSSSALAGVPALIKDLEDIEGLPTRKGSAAFADRPPATSDGVVPSRLKQAGAIVVGKSTLPEFALEGYTSNLATGVTRNPWNLDLSPGGSSGGSATAIAAGMVPIATATDGGGSIRIPAAFCGLVGLKPTNGVIGRWPTPDWIDFSTDGPFATTVSDLKLLMDVLVGPSSGDPSAYPAKAWKQYDNVKPTKIYAAIRTSDFGPLPTELNNHFESAVLEFANLLKLPVEWIEPGSLFGNDDPDLDWFTVATVEHLNSLGRDWVSSNFAQLHPASQEFLTQGMSVTVDEYLEARRRRYRYVRIMDELLAGPKLLLTPTVAEIGWLADGRLDEKSQPGSLPPEVYSTALQNVTGIPAISIPSGIMSNGLPGSIQVTGPRLSDSLLLGIAEQWESANPWQTVATGYASFDSILD